RRARHQDRRAAAGPAPVLRRRRIRRGLRGRARTSCAPRHSDRTNRHRAVLRNRTAALRGAVARGTLPRRARGDRPAPRGDASAPGAMHPAPRELILGGARPTAADAFAAFHQLEELRRTAEATFRTVDALALPTMPTVYTVKQVLADPIQLNSRLGTYTNFVN